MTHVIWALFCSKKKHAEKNKGRMKIVHHLKPNKLFKNQMIFLNLDK